MRRSKQPGNATATEEVTVTVYITNYNYGRYVKQAIQSVLDQSFRNFELLIIDDGSTDNSRDIICEYEGHPQVRIIFQANRGLNATNNIAVRAARGRYIMRLDADDFLDPNALLVMVQVLQNSADLAMVFPDYYYVDETGCITGQMRRHDFAHDVTLLDQPAHGACSLIRRDCLLEVGAYSNTFRCQDGVDLWLKIIERFKVRNVNLPLFYYRRHGLNLTENEEQILRTRAEIIRAQAERTKRPPLETVAVVPVRGSKADPCDVSLSGLGGKALIEWTIDAALSVPSINEIIITTPDQNVLNYVRDHYGEQLTLRLRPRELAGENISLAAAVNDALQHRRFQTAADAILELSIQYPFRDAVYIGKAIDKMRIFDVDCVVSVYPEDDLFYQHNGGGLRPVGNNGNWSGLRFERDLLYRQAGGITLTRMQSREAGRNIFNGRVGHILISRKASVRVFDMHELKLAAVQVDAVQQEATQTHIQTAKKVDRSYGIKSTIVAER